MGHFSARIRLRLGQSNHMKISVMYYETKHTSFLEISTIKLEIKCSILFIKPIQNHIIIISKDPNIQMIICNSNLYFNFKFLLMVLIYSVFFVNYICIMKNLVLLELMNFGMHTKTKTHLNVFL